MDARCILALVILLVSVVKTGNCARILGICPRPSISHQIVFRGLTLALHEQGHELVVVTTDPINDQKLRNYTEIDISFLYRTNYAKVLDVKYWFEFFEKVLSDLLNTETEKILNHPEFKKLYAPNSQEKFDLILLELIYWPAFLPLSKRFDAPVIGLSPMGLTLHVQYAFGNPIITSHPSNWELYTSASEPFTFWQRINNFVTFWRYMYHYRTVFLPSQEALARKYFGDDIPDISELERNVSLVFVNQQLPISYARPNVPKIMETCSFHVSKRIQTLPKDLQQLLDEATEGFVYMSLGSNMKSSMLSKNTLNEIKAAFSKLPYKVLWKFEDDLLSEKPTNVHTMKWIPQQAVLAHPNLKVFLYQGGLQSTEEAVSQGVPLIGFPTWADQTMQINKLVSLGVARKLDIATLNRHDLLEAIRHVASDNSYKKNMLMLRTLMKENSEKLVKNAIWWTEHVIRHKGAPYLQSNTADEPWFRRQDMDVIAFLSAASTISLILLIFILYRFLFMFTNVCSYFSLNKKEKMF